LFSLKSDLSAGRTILAALVGGIVGALIELVSPNEYDTVTVPVGILAVLLILA